MFTYRIATYTLGKRRVG